MDSKIDALFEVSQQLQASPRHSSLTPDPKLRNMAGCQRLSDGGQPVPDLVKAPEEPVSVAKWLADANAASSTAMGRIGNGRVPYVQRQLNLQFDKL